MYKDIVKWSMPLFLLVLSLGSSKGFDNWSRVRSVEGKCSAIFPKAPEYLKQTLPIQGLEKNLRYYVYIADNDKKEIFLVLVAQYPGVVNKEYAVKNLEHFLSTLISKNVKNKLLGAKLVQVQGHTGMDFAIGTDKLYFKGRAIQANNSLYLLAMECEISNYKEENFNFFINSFEIH